MKRQRLRALLSLLTSLLLFVASLAVFSGCGGGISGSITPVGTGSVTLAWQAPSTNEDGTPLTDLAGYRIYYGETSGVYTDVLTVGNYTSASIGSLPVGKTLYFAITAFDTSGNEGSPSNERSIIL